MILIRLFKPVDFNWIGSLSINELLQKNYRIGRLIRFIQYF